ncbi:MAG TPA: putative baseplate assembly protein [Allocoleopsis sp.]
MVKPAPKIDRRSAAEIARQLQDLLKAYATDWNEFEVDPVTGDRKPKGISAALIGVFARFGEIIIQRLNQVPDKNFLAFLNLLGASRLPPQPARVPLTFSLAAGSAVDVVVPAGTQVAAPPAEGEKEPVIFETERELVVTAAQLQSVFVRDPAQDQYADYSSLTNLSNSGLSTTALDLSVFRGNRAIEHILYIGHSSLLSFAQIQSLTLSVNLTKAPAPGAELSWQIWKDEEWQEIEPTSDTIAAKNLPQQNNQLTFTQTKDGSRFNAFPIKTVHTQASRWLRCQLKTPIASDAQAVRRVNMAQSAQLPTISGINLRCVLNRSKLSIEAAFINSIPIDDLSKSFFVFGEKPKFGDTLYLANREAFSMKGAVITLNIDLANPLDLGISQTAIAEFANARPILQWEFYNGSAWVPIMTVNRSAISSPSPLPNTFQDTTLAFTNFPTPNNLNPARVVKFVLPADQEPKETTINGVTNFWIRVRIISGNYGKESTFIGSFVPATFVSPVVNYLTVSYELTIEQPAENILTYNNFVERIIKFYSSDSFQPFLAFESTNNSKLVNRLTSPTIYLGFLLPTERRFPNQPLSLFFRTKDFKPDELLTPLFPTQSRQSAQPGLSVNHKFLVTNSAATEVEFRLKTLGMRAENPWEIVGVPQQFTLPPQASREVNLQVTIPQNAPLASSDRGFMQLLKSDEPEVLYSATFETIASPNPPSDQRLQLSWQYWNGSDWLNLTVRDDSENFTRSGLIEFLPPVDIAIREDFGLSPRYWLRAQWKSGNYLIEPRLERILLNTTIASQTITIANEILGSSNATENQIVRTTRSPVLEGQHLQVREPELPPAQEQDVIQRQEGDNAISSILDAAGRPLEIWVRWHEVPDFYGSGARDRHYVLNRLTGEIQFGNGLNGLIPPAGVGNLRMDRYRTGGGTVGNRPVGTIVQLKTTVPYVEKVTNPEAATGGTDAESLDSLIERMPRTIRHRGRAVTLEDYEDLAKLATPAVARAKGVSLRNLKLSNDSSDAQKIVPGAISVIVVPHSTATKPLPSLEVLNRIQDYLETNATLTAKVSVVPPQYLSVSITTEIALTALEGASEVERAVDRKLASFLHPLTGGLDGNGWDFGREPYKSDFYRQIESVPGVDHIRSLTVKLTVDGQEDLQAVQAIQQTGLYLVHSGKHTINLVFKES